MKGPESKAKIVVVLSSFLGVSVQRDEMDRLGTSDNTILSFRLLFLDGAVVSIIFITEFNSHQRSNDSSLDMCMRLKDRILHYFVTFWNLNAS